MQGGSGPPFPRGPHEIGDFVGWVQNPLSIWDVGGTFGASLRAERAGWVGVGKTN
jgi:hypothetical protein